MKNYFQKGITKLCTQLHPAWSTSIQLISTSTKLHSPPTSSFQPPPSSLQHPQYSNQNIIRNGAISPNLGQKLQSCPLWVKIGSHGLFQVLIPNPDFDFWNSDPKIHFWAILGSRSQLSVLSENWHVWYLKDADCYSNINFLKFQP